MLRHAGLWRPPAARRRRGMTDPPRLRRPVGGPGALRRVRRCAGAAGAAAAPVAAQLDRIPRGAAAARRALPCDRDGHRRLRRLGRRAGRPASRLGPGSSLELLDALGIDARRCGRPPHRRRDRGRAGGGVPERVARPGAVVDAVHRRSLPARARRAAADRRGRAERRRQPSRRAVAAGRQAFYPAGRPRAARGLRARCAEGQRRRRGRASRGRLVPHGRAHRRVRSPC